MSSQKNAITSIYKCAICGFYVDKPIHCGVSAALLMSSEDRLKLSKLMSGILRHYPHVAGLHLDNEGYTSISDLLRAIKTWKHGGFNWVTIDHILAITHLDPKGRFEVVGDKIRAVYGHSYAVAPHYPLEPKPGTLYHGTQLDKLPSIIRNGLKPMSRLYVHLTNSMDNAWENACRRKGTPVVLFIDGDNLAKSGFKVYRASELIYLTKYVPSRFITKVIRQGG